MLKTEKEKIRSYRRNSNLFLRALAAEVVVLGQENWDNLSDDVFDPKKFAMIVALTHKDHLDGPNLWPSIFNNKILLKFIVMTEGFYQGMGRLRGIMAKAMGGTVPLSRHKSTHTEMKNIKKEKKNGVVPVLFLPGGRDLMNQLKPGLTGMLTNQSDKYPANDVIYPYINLSDTIPAFVSGSSFMQNMRELLQRTIIKRKNSKEFLYLMKPITKSDLDLMKEGKKSKLGRIELLEKLEVVRAYGILKMMIEVASLGVTAANPLLGNSDNIPLLKQSKKRLKEDTDRVEWLIDKGYFTREEINLLVALPI